MTEEEKRRAFERENTVRSARLVGRVPDSGWNIFDTSTREGWFNRTVRAVLTAGERPYRGPAKDIVLTTTTTQFGNPDECFDGPTVGRRHQPRGLFAQSDNEHIYRCSKCGAVFRTVWKDQPSAWRVVAGVR